MKYLLVTLFVFLSLNAFAEEITSENEEDREYFNEAINEEREELEEEEQEEIKKSVRIRDPIIPEIKERNLSEIDEVNFKKVVVFQALNKITAKTFELKGKVGQKVKFEKMIVHLLKCWQAPPEEKPENKVLLKVYEVKPNNESVLIFYGWMLSSSPGLSGLEHPIYDITIKNCK